MFTIHDNFDIYSGDTCVATCTANVVRTTFTGKEYALRTWADAAGAVLTISMFPHTKTIIDAELTLGSSVSKGDTIVQLHLHPRRKTVGLHTLVRGERVETPTDLYFSQLLGWVKTALDSCGISDTGAWNPGGFVLSA